MMPIARTGDRDLCPICGPDMIVIVAGGTATIGGIPVARVGGKTPCTAVITAGATMLSDGNRPVAWIGAPPLRSSLIARGARRGR